MVKPEKNSGKYFCDSSFIIRLKESLIFYLLEMDWR